jgi:hypothetical protein
MERRLQRDKRGYRNGSIKCVNGKEEEKKREEKSIIEIFVETWHRQLSDE